MTKIIVYRDNQIKDSINKAEVKTKESKVLSFKMFMPNEDILQIVKK